MVTDIERLESAARLAMGSFEGPSALPAADVRQRRFLIPSIGMALVIAAFGLVAAAIS
jgi:hypothetical protein